MTTLSTAILGYPRMGANRELKRALESYWRGDISADDLHQVGATIRKRNWDYQKKAGIRYIPSNDFSYYDQILDFSCFIGNIPPRFGYVSGPVDLDLYFSIARGNTKDSSNNQYAAEMTKWFDTNYHYIVPEFDEATEFSLTTTTPFDAYKEAKKWGVDTRPVIVGPLTYLSIGKSTDGSNKWALLDKLIAVYGDILKQFEAIGVTDIQIDEPIAVTKLNNTQKEGFKRAYDAIAAASSVRLHLTTYFGDLRDNQSLVYSLPVYSIHVDVTRLSTSFETVLAGFPADKQLSLGVVNGRNIWVNAYDDTIQKIQRAQAVISPDRIVVATSCSLLHVPVTLANETDIDESIKQWLVFADEKVHELVDIVTGFADPSADALGANRAVQNGRKTSALIHNNAVKTRLSQIKPLDYVRSSGFSDRSIKQKQLFNLPVFPTTTIGSFPQTDAVRKARRDFKNGGLSANEYESFLKDQIRDAVAFQEDIGLDVLVHGEFERNDMVEYFGEQLNGFAFTSYGWVQSYGSRCVKPPIIFGDVSRPKPMTVDWSVFAQSLTVKPMKGMLTGPVTILQWSFVRDDQPRKDTAMQIALAIRDEVCDLEKAGIGMIQIDEAALREGLPVHVSDWDAYLRWAVDTFRLVTGGVMDSTQIHTHMCYSEFNDIIEAIARMDADVISIETSRSHMALLDAFVKFNYPNDVGPGVYDIHSPRVPTVESMSDLLKKATKLLPVEHIWVNPDCGLKTRGWPEVKDALTHMITSAKQLRESHNVVSVRP
jgi:5-methyltetrahydropteroyltriglutamate--homocysteine methyltransferase